LLFNLQCPINYLHLPLRWNLKVREGERESESRKEGILFHADVGDGPGNDDILAKSREREDGF